MISLAVFDLAGTTLEDDASGVFAALNDAIVAAGFHVSEREIWSQMGVRKIDAIRHLLPNASSESVHSIHEDFRARMITFYRESASVRAYEGIPELFIELRQVGVRVALDTGFDAETVRVILDRLAWHLQIDAWVASDQVPEGRPAPYMIRDLMHKTGVTDPRQVAKIGDTPTDIAEGVNAMVGLNLAVTYGTHSADQLRAIPGAELIHSVPELSDRLMASARA
jgi:phosphonatase-like hydrolase